MKAKFLCALAATLLAVGASRTHAADLSVNVFYDSLEPYGDWVETDDYGYTWHPRDVDENWRPYTVGSWAYTDAGWTWVSEEPYGWATYHYGRWVDIDRVGWSWVPDREWGPAWVSWRRSDSHVGWAPLPPEARFENRTGLHAWVDSYYDIGPTSYSFVSVRDFGSPRLRSVIVQPRENITIIRETRNITNITYVDNVVMNNGPEYDVVSRESAQPVRRLRLERRTDVDFAPGGDRGRFNAQVAGDVLRVAAPAVAVDRAVAPRAVAQKLGRVEVDRGWKRAGDPQAVQALRAKVASEAKAPAGLPPAPALRGSDRTPAAGAAAAPAARTAAEPAAVPATPAPSAAAAARKGKERAPTAAAQPPTPASESKPETAVAPPKARKGKTPPAETAAGTAPAEPSPAERGMKRPEARATDEAQAPRDPQPTPDRPKKRERSPNAPDAPGAQTTPGERPPGIDRPEPPQRPGAGPRPETPQRPDAAERPQRPEAAERPQRKGPPGGAEERSPVRARPEMPERSPESRPPSPEGARPQPNAPKKGAPGKPGEPEKEKKPE